MNLGIDLNADLGEGAGNDEALLDLVSSANIACGLHAGDARTMAEAIREAQKRGVAIGAHPSLDDRENFGRRELLVSPAEVQALVTKQLGIFAKIVDSLGGQFRQVKPHGALYNMAARDHSLAEAVVQSVRDFDPRLILFAPPASALCCAAEAKKLRVAREVFADRNYLASGALVPREHPEALLHDPELATQRVVRMLREGKVRAIDGSEIAVQAETVCVHGDTPDAVEFARQLRTALEGAGVMVRALA